MDFITQVHAEFVRWHFVRVRPKCRNVFYVVCEFSQVRCQLFSPKTVPTNFSSFCANFCTDFYSASNFFANYHRSRQKKKIVWETRPWGLGSGHATQILGVRTIGRQDSRQVKNGQLGGVQLSPCRQLGAK